MVVILRRAAASLVGGASLLVSGSNLHGQGLWDSATEPVRQLLERDRYTASEMQRASRSQPSQRPGGTRTEDATTSARVHPVQCQCIGVPQLQFFASTEFQPLPPYTYGTD